MNRALFALVCAALGATLLLWNPASAHRESKSLVGTWSLDVTPQPHPDVPTVPPPFLALVAFERGGTLTETDSGFHPGASVVLFPNLGPLSSSDGWGAWEAVGNHEYRARLVKLLFDASGAHVGFQITRLEVALRAADQVEARADSDFVLGNDLNAAPFFSGGISLVKGARLGVDD